MSLALARYSGMRSAVPISRSICMTASLAPPCIGPHSEAMPAATHANGLASDDPASRTVDVDAFCSWSACSRKKRSMAWTNASGGVYLKEARRVS